MAAVAVATGGAVVAGSTPAQAAAPVRGGGFVWASPAVVLGTYTPLAAYNTNSTAPVGSAVNTVTRSVEGGEPIYTVRMPGLGLEAGTVQVTAYGNDSVACQVAYWLPLGNDQAVRVRCHDNAGTAVNSRFTMAYTSVTASENGRIGYVWADSPAAPAYTPNLAFQANSTGAINTITRSGVGVYRVYMPGLGAAGGHVQVTPYGLTPARCVVWFWLNNAGTEEINVKCFTMAGAPTDSRFTVTFVDGTNILGLGNCCDPAGYATAYAWANDATLPGPYQPSPSYEFSHMQPFAVPGARRIGVGHYAISWQPWISHNHGNVQVTAYGASAINCKVDYWNNPDGIRVRCFTATGAPADSRYTVAFTGPNQVIL